MTLHLKKRMDQLEIKLREHTDDALHSLESRVSQDLQVPWKPRGELLQTAYGRLLFAFVQSACDLDQCLSLKRFFGGTDWTCSVKRALDSPRVFAHLIRIFGSGQAMNVVSPMSG